MKNTCSKGSKLINQHFYLFFRWDASSIDQLSGYMKLCYQSLLQVYDEAEAEMAEAGRPLYGLSYAKEAVSMS